MANMWLYVRLLCLMQRTVFSAFKMCHFELQNVCKAENVFKVLETWEEVLLSVCQFKYLCYACHFSVLATGKNCNVLCFVVFRYVLLYCVTLRCTVLCCIALHCIMLCYVISCCVGLVVLCNVVLWCDMFCYAIFCLIVLCYAMLYYVIACCIIFVVLWI